MSRIGAFEVTILYKNQYGNIISKCIFSKLQTKKWPIKEDLQQSVKSFLIDNKFPVLQDISYRFIGLFI